MTVSEPLQEVPHQGGLASACFSSENVQTATRLDTEHQLGNCSLISLAREQEARIGRNVERILPQAEGAEERVVAFRCACSGHRTPEGTAWGE